ncbi:sialidase family protein [Pleomorphovibrio marinus]|uniref:sialidase family protein n=1 Tax=Pleomorphovibrio marinus TaxID=2164132 RepID=UPI000E0A4AB1|nr:sialidase family protein [Pleomorphovibrio marinus]
MNRISIVTCLICFFLNPLLILGQDDSFLQPAELISLPSSIDIYKPESREFTGISSLAVTEKGHVWAVWYTGITPDEDHNNYVVLAHSEDGGQEWKEVMAIDPDGDGPVRAFDPEIWLDPDGKLWVFWAQTIGKDGTVAGVWAITAENPSTGSPTWSAPKRLTDGVMMCKPTVLSTGEWVLPSSTWRKTDNSAKMVVSTDKGATWQVRGAVHVPEENRVFDEHIIVEKKDGTLWMLLRTNYGIGESFSSDRGQTWSSLQASPFEHPSARFFITRLQSENLLLIKHGPKTVKTGRSHLMAFISLDDGETWSRGLLLDERPGVSYPDGQQHKDGDFFLTYDFDRRESQEILMTTFSEEDVLANDYDNRLFRVFENRKVIGKGGEQ